MLNAEQKVLDRLVEAAHGGRNDRIDADMAQLEEYLQESGALDEAGDTWYFASLDDITHDLNDSRLYDRYEFDDDEVPTDAQRVEFAREQLDEIPQGMGDSDDVPVHLAHQLQHSDGRTAFVVSEHRGYSFTEITVDLRGPYTTYEDAQRPPYDGCVSDASEISDAEILARWERDG